jgi:hypothetical protein
MTRNELQHADALHTKIVVAQNELNALLALQDSYGVGHISFKTNAHTNLTPTILLTRAEASSILLDRVNKKKAELAKSIKEFEEYKP